MIFVPSEKEGGCKGHEITTRVRQGEPGDKAIAYTHVYTCTYMYTHGARPRQFAREHPRLRALALEYRE